VDLGVAIYFSCYLIYYIGGEMIMKKKMFFIVAFKLLWAVLAFSTDFPMIKLTKTAVSSLPENVIVPNLGSIVIDSKGNIFAFAGKSGGKECFIVKFDANLKYLKRFGREGHGPSEFTVYNDSHENRLMVAGNSDVYVIDHNPTRFVVFDNDGNYKTDIPYRRDYYHYFGHISRFKALGNNVFVGVQYVKEKPYIGVLFSLNPPQVKVNYQYSGEVITISGPFGYSQLSNRICGHNPLIDTDSQNVVFCDAQAYKFRVYDSSGSLILEVWDKKRNVRNFSDKEMQIIIYDQFTIKEENTALENNYLEQLLSYKSIYKGLLEKIRKNKNVVSAVQISGERIFVFPVGEDITRKNFYPVEVYNLKGHVVKEGYFRGIPEEIWNGYVFFSERDEEDNPFIVKYKLDEAL
jgi:hypothetical protein